LHIKKTASALFLALASLASTAGATVIGFDDVNYLNGDPAALANGYQGFDWNNFWSSRAGYNPQFAGGLVSGDNIGFMISAGSVSSFSSAAPFTFNGVNIAKMYYNGLTHFEGYAGNTLVYSQDVFAARGATSYAAFNWTGLTRVDISVRDGSERIVFDNLTVNEQVSNVPEPASISLVLAGLGLAGLAGKRRKQA
jgi:hypothetical protein